MVEEEEEKGEMVADVVVGSISWYCSCFISLFQCT